MIKINFYKIISSFICCYSIFHFFLNIFFENKFNYVYCRNNTTLEGPPTIG